MTDEWEMHPETGLNPGPVWRDRGVIINTLTARNQALEERVAELELAALNLRDNTQGAHEREQALRERLTELADAVRAFLGRYDTDPSASDHWPELRVLRAALAASPAVEGSQIPTPPATAGTDATPEPTPAALNCPVCGSGEEGNCVCGPRNRCICNDAPIAREVVCVIHPNAHLLPTPVAEPQAEGGADERWPFSLRSAAALIARCAWVNEPSQYQDQWSPRLIDATETEVRESTGRLARQRFESAWRALGLSDRPAPVADPSGDMGDRA